MDQEVETLTAAWLAAFGELPPLIDAELMRPLLAEALQREHRIYTASKIADMAPQDTAWWTGD